MIETKELRKRIRQVDKPWLVVMRCGWCKGFVHSEIVSGDMTRYVHDEKPRTEHEVLPYRHEG